MFFGVFQKRKEKKVDPNTVVEISLEVVRKFIGIFEEAGMAASQEPQKVIRRFFLRSSEVFGETLSVGLDIAYDPGKSFFANADACGRGIYFVALKEPGKFVIADLGWIPDKDFIVSIQNDYATAPLALNKVEFSQHAREQFRRRFRDFHGGKAVPNFDHVMRKLFVGSSAKDAIDPVEKVKRLLNNDFMDAFYLRNRHWRFVVKELPNKNFIVLTAEIADRNWKLRKVWK